MGNLWTTVTNNLPEWSSVPLYIRIMGAVAVGGTTLIILRRSRGSNKSKTEYPRDTVIHHQIGRGPWAPSMTPFAVKLETYLRLAKIPYVNVHDMKMSSKGKSPWIEYNGEPIADTMFIIIFLNKKLDIDLNSHLSAEQRGIGRAFQKMAEENTYWTFGLYRWYYDKELKCLDPFKIPFLMKWYISRTFSRKVKKCTEAHGIGRHSEEEVSAIMYGDLKAISDYLGKKKYLFGDKPCEYDCAIFGLLSQMYWHSFGNPTQAAIKEFPNLCEYCERMKDTIWPDWEKCITHGGTVKATG